MYHDARKDKKLEALTDAQHRVWFNLLCYASDQDDSSRGVIPLRSLSLLAVEVAKGDESLLVESLDRLEALDIVQRKNNKVLFVHWKARQFESDSSTGRVRKHRAKIEDRPKSHSERDTERGGNVSETFPKRYPSVSVALPKRDVTPPDTDTDTDLKSATTTPRESKVADSDAAPDNLLDRAMHYLTGTLQHPVGFSPVEAQQIQRSLAVVDHDFLAWQRVIESAVAVHAKSHPGKRIRTFHYFVGPFEDLAEVQEARQVPRQAVTRPARAAAETPGYADANQETLKQLTAAYEAAHTRKESV